LGKQWEVVDWTGLEASGSVPRPCEPGKKNLRAP
jgi:hypothetical protein